MAFFELRQYYVHPGKMDEWVRLMDDKIIPFQISKGMVVTGSFRGESDDSVYFWIRRFASEEDRKRLYEAVYESNYWIHKIGPVIPNFLDRDRAVITRVIPTSMSTMQ